MTNNNNNRCRETTAIKQRQVGSVLDGAWVSASVRFSCFFPAIHDCQTDSGCNDCVASFAFNFSLSLDYMHLKRSSDCVLHRIMSHKMSWTLKTLQSYFFRAVEIEIVIWCTEPISLHLPLYKRLIFNAMALHSLLRNFFFFTTIHRMFVIIFIVVGV